MKAIKTQMMELETQDNPQTGMDILANQLCAHPLQARRDYILSEKEYRGVGAEYCSECEIFIWQGLPMKRDKRTTRKYRLIRSPLDEYTYFMIKNQNKSKLFNPEHIHADIRPK